MREPSAEFLKKISRFLVQLLERGEPEIFKNFFRNILEIAMFQVPGIPRKTTTFSAMDFQEIRYLVRSRKVGLLGRSGFQRDEN